MPKSRIARISFAITRTSIAIALIIFYNGNVEKEGKAVDEEKQRQLEIIAKNLQTLMDSRGMNNRDLAKMLDMNETTIGKWVNANNSPSMGAVRKIAAYFGVGVPDIVMPHNDNVFADPNRKYLLDRIENASSEELRKLRAMMDLIEGENDRQR